MLSLIRYMKERGITQAEFARRLGISESMLSYCLRGERRPGVSVALKIRRLTGITLDELYGRGNHATDTRRAGL